MVPTRSIRTTQGAQEGTSWVLAEVQPHELLKGTVERYQGYEERSPAGLRRIEPAQDRVTLILGFGEAIVVGSERQAPESHQSFLAPLAGGWASTEFRGRSRGIQVDLSPLGARAVFGLPWTTLGDGIVIELGELLGREADLLTEQLADARDWSARFGIVDHFLLDRLAEAPQPRPDVAHAFWRMRASGGRIPIDALCEELGCSRRHLTRHFRTEVGLGPKATARILRFQRAAALLKADDGSRFAEIAAGCGYHDQPHMVRDFRSLAGLSPSALLRSSRSGPPGLTA